MVIRLNCWVEFFDDPGGVGKRVHVASSTDVVNLPGAGMRANVSDEGWGVVVVVGGDFGDGAVPSKGGEEFGGGDFVGRRLVKSGVCVDEANDLGVGKAELV